MNFCAVCGNTIEQPPASESESGRRECARCGEVFYEGPRVIAVVFAYRDNKLLLHKRRHEPGINRWTIPSGYVEMNETPDQAIIRETIEETGVVISPDDLHPYFNVGFSTINEIHLAFRTQVSAAQKPVAGPESLEVAFLSQSEINLVPLAFRETVGDYTGFFFEHLEKESFPFMSVDVTGNPKQPMMQSRSYALGPGGAQIFEMIEGVRRQRKQ
jgi:ADP-ribose pyrophosphatase YjhB (NUDIX family)